jgi:DNA-binding response OmpR family regulator
VVTANRTILFIEDEPDAATVYRTHLTKEGYVVLVARDATKGLSLAKSDHPAVILLDLMLPETSGFEVLRQLASDSETKGIPVLAFTNLAEEVGFERAIGLGAVGYVVKTECPPHRMSILLKHILSESSRGKVSHGQ